MTSPGTPRPRGIPLSRTDLSEVVRHLEYADAVLSSLPEQRHRGRASTIRRLRLRLAAKLPPRPPADTTPAADDDEDEATDRQE